MKYSVKPEDILPDDVNEKTINGIVARKGTIAALIGNIKKLEDPSTPEEVKINIIETIKDLVPAANAIGLFDIATIKNTEVQNIIDEQLLILGNLPEEQL